MKKSKVVSTIIMCTVSEKIMFSIDLQNTELCLFSVFTGGTDGMCDFFVTLPEIVCSGCFENVLVMNQRAMSAIMP